MNHLVLSFLLFLTAFAGASQIGIRVMNTDARLVVTPGGESTVLVDTLIRNGVQIDLEVPWSTTLEYHISPLSSIFADTVYIHTGVAEYWNNAITIVPPERTYSSDTAYIPLRSNVNATAYVRAVDALGGKSEPISYQLNGGESVIAALPLDLTTGIRQHRSESRSFEYTVINGAHIVSLPIEFRKGSLELFNMKGQRLGKMNLSAPLGNALSIWNVASGIYTMRAVSAKGTVNSVTLHHRGGDLKVKTGFVAVSGAVKSTTIVTQSSQRTARASQGSFEFEIVPQSSDYSDTTIDRTLSSEKNEPLTVLFSTGVQPEKLILEQYMDTLLYNELFPHRIGMGLNTDTENGDFYSHANFQAALDTIGEYHATIYRKSDVPVGDRWVVENSAKGTNYTYITNSDYERGTAAEESFEVDYGSFLMEGTLKQCLYELVAFLSNISQETNGRYESDLVPDKGLFFKEEYGLNDSTVGRYFSTDATYPAVATQSYHGRGPKQLSYNYNYGQFSDFFYGDKNVLLDNPRAVSHDPIVAFASALWFWMTPQGIKPSCHDVMVGNWVPTAEDIAKGRDKSLFGMTINVINGGVECGGGGEEVQQVKNRVEFLQRYSDYFWIEPEEYCGCAQMQNFNQ